MQSRRGISFRGGKIQIRMYWSYGETSASTASASGSLDLDTNQSSLLLNLEARRATSIIHHLWHRSWNTFRWTDNSPRSIHCWQRKFVYQLSTLGMQIADRAETWCYVQDFIRSTSFVTARFLVPLWWLRYGSPTMALDAGFQWMHFRWPVNRSV